MGSSDWLPIQVSHLELGLPLRYDIFTETGDPLATAGDEFTPSLKLAWDNLGISRVCIRTAPTEQDATLLKPYDPALIKRLEENMQLASDIVREMAARRNDKQVFTSMEFQELSRSMMEDVQNDSAAALLSLFNSNRAEQTENDHLLAERSSRMSLLSMIIASEMGWNETECQIAGTAAVLHDISLMGFKIDADPDDQLEFYRQHPLKSAYIVDAIVGINPKVSMAIAQAHEAPAGDGFPRGLHHNRIMPAARILNLADTYLTLTSPRQPAAFPVARNFHPSDAIGYIMYHAALGQFEVDAVRALVRSTSLYPIGSSVRLSDDSTGVVFRSTRIAPTKPIIRLDSTQKLVDLRHSSLSITGANRGETGEYNLMQRTQLSDVMWG